MTGHEFQSWFPDSGGIDYDDVSTNITEATLDELRSIAGRYPQARSALLPMLHLVQSVDGRVSPRGIEACAEILGIEADHAGRDRGQHRIEQPPLLVRGLVGGHQLLAAGGELAGNGRRSALDIDRLDLARRRGANGAVIALADHVIVFDDPPKRRQREDVGHDILAAFARDGEDEALFGQRQFQLVGAALGIVDRREAVFLDQVEDRDRALMLDVGRRTANRFVEDDIDQLGVGATGARHLYMFNLMATERACASRPSALASVIAAGASAFN